MDGRMTHLEAWEQYGQRCRENWSREQAELMADFPNSPQSMAEIHARWAERHAESWAKYVAEAG